MPRWCSPTSCTSDVGQRLDFGLGKDFPAIFCSENVGCGRPRAVPRSAPRDSPSWWLAARFGSFSPKWRSCVLPASTCPWAQRDPLVCLLSSLAFGSLLQFSFICKFQEGVVKESCASCSWQRALVGNTALASVFKSFFPSFLQKTPDYFSDCFSAKL